MDTIEVIIHSNRFGRCFWLRVPADATSGYLMGMLRGTLNLKFSNVDETLGVELSYTYYLRHKGKAITLNTPLNEEGVKDGDRLELWIQVTLRDLIEDKEIKFLPEGDKMMLHFRDINFNLKQLSDDNRKLKNMVNWVQLLDDIRKARKRAFSSADIARIASQFFAHVDK